MSMIHLLILAVHLLATIAKLLRPGGVRVVVAESLLLKHQLVIGSRARRRAPNLNSFDRVVLGLGSLFVPASRWALLRPKYRRTGAEWPTESMLTDSTLRFSNADIPG